MAAPILDHALRVLHLEDSPLDHELTLAHLRRGGLEVQALRIDSESAFLAALEQEWDVVLSDFNLPGFSGLVALDLLKASGLDVPFILVSGEIGEDTAVEAMRNGASDYLLKNNLARLVPALMHAVEATETRHARERADRELGKSKQRLRELAQHLQTSIEQERAAIAREIHDDVGGSLTALKFDLAWIARHTTDEGVRLRVNSALETVTLAIESSKRIMHNLRPAILEQGLVAALQWIASRFEKRTGIACELRLPTQTPEWPAGVPLVAYRTAQEALTNITKHAQASRVQIDLSLAGGVMSLEISDNGRGLSQQDLAKARSFGIRGLHERAGTVGGWVDLSSGPAGTTLILSVPLNPIGDTSPAPAHPLREPEDPSQWGTL
ncbi:sensor histidine kinase [Rhizobacter sp. AJA081-3]|uniref:hybrid sensor histidine kinase/response regulator n=1 Tax=Rhizobacter sp. AJA081-3 TaxID=2753607 RepID=UPI001ADFFB03|nr:sensor histidine kinase [Rhizobacter sp. AJA081-3]QTN24409.1 sensor histidine kinase [Rhizobacter sp. AJA081-3]